MKNKLIFLLGMLLSGYASAQKTEDVTMSDIWLQYKFFGSSVEGFHPLKNGDSYSTLEPEAGNPNLNDVLVHSYQTGQVTDTLLLNRWLVPQDSMKLVHFSDYILSADESKVLIPTHPVKIYRRSSTCTYFIFDRKTKKTTALSAPGGQRDAAFSPDGKSVAFCRDNNLFIKNLETGEEKQATNSGEKNKIINGTTDWVYEEEFEFTRAWQWSPDGKRLAYMQFDETDVPEYTIQFFNDKELYPENYTYKYPKVGEKNSIVKVFMYDLETGKTALVDIGTETDQYIPRMKWTDDANELCITRMNRLQNHLDLLIADWKQMTWNSSPNARYKAAGWVPTRVMFTEENARYIDIHDNLTFLHHNQQFLWTSEQDGHNHIYIYNTADGKLVRQVTSGDWEVTAFYGYDEATGTIYYQGTETNTPATPAPNLPASHSNPLERTLCSIQEDGSGKVFLPTRPGSNDAEFSSNFHFFLHSWSDANTPPYYTMDATGGGTLRVLESNADLISAIQGYHHTRKTFFSFPAADGKTLHGWMMLPVNFKKGKKYPVMMYLYGGPGSQEVLNGWDYNYMYWTYLNEHGYIVACIDNRGTGGQGEEFKKMTYKKLGQLEVDDQIAGANWMGSQPYVDKSRIGVWGWSFGGYMRSLLIEKGASVYKMAIAVAPVIDWRFYDSIYTERYMQDNKTNKEGYDTGSPINFTGQIKGKFMLVHGLSDDNVHYQNTATFLNALYRNNVVFTQYTFPNKNHSISGGNTHYYLFCRMAEFILANL